MNEEGGTRRRFVVGAVSVTLTGLTGCTGSPFSEPEANGSRETTPGSQNATHASSHGSSLDGPSASATVSMVSGDDGTHFEPHVVWVEQGGTVTWELESGSHTTTAYHEAVDRPRRIPAGAKGWDSGTLSEAGATFDHTFETAGVFDYFCTPHEATGMLGSIIVGEPDAAGQPGLAPPQDGLPEEAAAKIESLNERVRAALTGGGSGDGGHANESGDGSTNHGGNETAHSDGGHH